MGLTQASEKQTTTVEELTHAPRLAHRVSSEYQRARLNVFVAPKQRQQIDALGAEWNCPLVEAVRRVLDLGLLQIMHADQ
jgi:hypothetical protein